MEGQLRGVERGLECDLVLTPATASTFLSRSNFANFSNCSVTSRNCSVTLGVFGLFMIIPRGLLMAPWMRFGTF